VRVARTIAEVRAELHDARPQKTIGLVPTMGALHQGHVSLFEAARRENDLVVASLFVNPAQFDDPADLARYAVDEDADTAAAERSGVDLLFAPRADELYPAGFDTWIEVGEAARGGEGDARPGHFRGVATVCAKLFNIVQPDRAYFGQKDAQQVAVLEQLVRDLNLELTLRVLPIVRDADGLALSSRNARLSPEERAHALQLPNALRFGREAFLRGDDPVAAARAALNGLHPDYVETRDVAGATVLAAAVHVGSTRLIDNVLLKGELQ
jgi:pantoate--beta-alanine ligase